MKIEDIKSPEFLKELNIEELEKLSEDIRRFIIDNVSKTGGHLSSNLGVVEMTIALHYVFNSPYDKLIFDVSHQCYTHKILTGRAKDFNRLRQSNGISGFENYNESIHDVWEAGHSSTAISAAAGFLEAKAAGEEIGEVISIVGDGSIQNGVSFEGLNFLGNSYDHKSIIIINDNDMSVGRNTGRIAKRLSKIRIRKSYARFKRIIPSFIRTMFRGIKNALKYNVYNNRNNPFYGLGYEYYGPIDGHNIKEMIEYFEFAKRSKTSLILHVKTIKGKGYTYSENDKLGNWHSVSKFDIESGRKIPNDNTKTSWGQGIADILLEKAKNNRRIIAICPAMIPGASLLNFQKELPKQLIDTGIAEEHAVIMAASSARNNMIPFVSIYSTFLQRSYDEINHDVCRNSNHVIFLIDRCGIIDGDGSTHQGIFDIAFLSHLPNMVICMPKDLSEAKLIIDFAILYNGPVAIRYQKSLVHNTLTNNKEKIELGKWKIELSIQDINIITYGPDINEYKELLKNENIGLINALFIKPIDEEMLNSLSNKTLVVVEEVIKDGSLYSLINDYKTKNKLNLNIISFAIDDYIGVGIRDEIRDSLGISPSKVIEKILER